MGALKDNKSESDLMDIEELCGLIKMSKKFILKHRRSGRIPGIVRIADTTFRYRRSIIEKRLNQGQFLLEK